MTDVRNLRPHLSTLSARDGGIEPPAEIISSWPTPNYVDPETRGWGTPIALIVIMGFTFLVYMLRLWARLMLAKNPGIDDIFMTIAIVPLFALTISVFLAITMYGFQWHVWDQTPKTLITSRQITMSIELNYMVSTTLIKISILCFYRRITGALTTQFVYWVYGMIIFVAIYGFVFTFLIAFTCTPTVGYFHAFDIVWRLTHELHCHDEGAIIVACAAISTVQDLVICMLPIFLISSLHIPVRQKIALCFLFGLGIVTCVCGILRTYYATYVYYYTYDITWYAWYGWVWTCLEAQLGVICASIPALKVFFRRYFAMVSSRMGYSGGSGRTPLERRRSRGNGGLDAMALTHSAENNRTGEPESHDVDVPLSSIKVEQDFRIDERDAWSRGSYSSTKTLTALPLPRAPGWTGDSEWEQGCRKLSATLKPVRAKMSPSKGYVADIERIPAGS